MAGEAAPSRIEQRWARGNGIAAAALGLPDGGGSRRQGEAGGAGRGGCSLHIDADGGVSAASEARPVDPEAARQWARRASSFLILYLIY